MLKTSFPPVAAAGAETLILGSLPGDESLRQRQYYAYSRNAFWPIMGALFDFDPALDYADRIGALTANRVALWDVVAAGRRPGSLDGNLEPVAFNDISGLLARFPTITRIGCNGGAAFNQLRRGFSELFAGKTAIARLPSTSPAAAGIPFAVKLAAYRRWMIGESG
jgi:hypoxanthine-DNA glycosylase